MPGIACAMTRPWHTCAGMDVETVRAMLLWRNLGRAADCPVGSHDIGLFVHIRWPSCSAPASSIPLSPSAGGAVVLDSRWELAVASSTASAGNGFSVDLAVADESWRLNRR